LQENGLANGAILNLSKLVGINLSLVAAAPRFSQIRRTQKTSHDIISDLA
jgi:hypothetical protein